MGSSLSRHERRIIISAEGIWNASILLKAKTEAGIYLPAAVALIEQESHGRNGYGRYDKGGALRGYPGLVTEENFRVFQWLVTSGQANSNGVGPAQITFYPYFAEMERQGLKPWDPFDNMVFGFGVLDDYVVKFTPTNGIPTDDTWFEAGRRYNAGPNPKPGVGVDYGREFADKVAKWERILKFTEA